jgi:Carboxypeptidase regulatory-like domain/TonB dependent receptor
MKHITRYLSLSLSLVVFSTLAMAGTALAQDSRGLIRGRVTDATGSIVVSAKVVAVNEETQTRASAESNADGLYNIPFLLPGKYTVTAELRGFKLYSRSGVQVRVSETTDLNIQMELGEVTEKVEVKAETPLLDTAGSSLGQVIDTRRIQELPLAALNPLELALLAPGMVEPSKFQWNPAWNFRNIASDGNPAYTTEYQIDGVSNTFAEGNAGRNRYAFAPPASAVQEFKMQTTPYDASIGHTMSSVVNVSTANGTNQLHGEAHWFVKNSAFDAPNFFNNRNSTKVPVYQDNRYGASGGGPVIIPKLYNGRNKTFWYYAWEANKWGIPQTFTGTVPTEAQRQGNFSALLGANLCLNASSETGRCGGAFTTPLMLTDTDRQTVQAREGMIYDPATTQAAGGGRFSRRPFARNIIPQGRLDKVGLALVNLYPLPNQPGTADGRNNYFNGSIKAAEDYFVHMVRIDHAWNENHRSFVRVHYDRWEEDKDHWFSNNVNGIILNRINRGLALDDVIVIKPALVLNLRYGLTSQEFPERRVSQGFDLTSLGFSPSLVSLLVDPELATIPRVAASGFSSFSGWESGDGTTTSLTHNVSGHLTKLQGNHNLKFGADARWYHANGNRYPRATAPDLSFSNTYTRGPLDNSPAAPIGQELASLLLGVPGGSMERTASFAMQDKFIGFYLHDDFKVSAKITLNLGLRYEIETPLTERFNRLVAGFDFDTPNPVEAAARANYAKSPIPELPIEEFRARGGLIWAGQGGNGRSPFKTERNNFMPRFGLAWQFKPQAVLRGGFGIFYDTIGVNATRAIQTGFSQTTPIQASLDQGLTFITTTANPFPNGVLSPLGPAGGLATNLGQSLEFYSSGRTHPYSQRWSLGVQHLLPGNFVAEADYVASRATRLSAFRELNAIPARYLSTKPTRDQATIDFLSATFPNPFFGTNPIFGSRISRADLLKPYPQFGSITAIEPIGYSWYHSLQVRAERRFSNGFTFQLGYTWSKLMEAVEFLNPSDTTPYEVIGNFDRTHRLAMSGIWEIPLGRGRRFGATLPAPVQWIIGGWQIGSIVVRQSGAPLGFGNVPFDGDLKAIPLPKSQRSVDRWFNTEAGFERNSGQQFSFALRTLPLRFSGIRGDGRATWDFSAIKNFKITERSTLQLRTQVFNAWNHPNFNDPNTNPIAGNFGRITGAGEGRNWQFALKLRF